MRRDDYLNKKICLSLLMFPIANLGLFVWRLGLGNVELDIDGFLFFKEVALLTFVAAAEELFFRGLLLRELIFGYQYKPLLSTIVVSALFGALHILNIFSYTTTFFISSFLISDI